VRDQETHKVMSTLEHSEKTTNKQENEELVVDFLRRISAAAGKLAHINGGYERMDESGDESAAHFIDLTARHLLKACDPEILAGNVSNLPELGTDEDKNFGVGEDEDEEEILKTYQYRRTDYLRQLLRLMAPVSMDIAANICSIVISSHKGSPTVRQAAFLLLSHWLPVAPHLTSMATDLLKSLDNPWTGIDTNQQQTLFLFAEACHSFCSFFAKRGQMGTIRNMWDWTFLFGLMQSTDTEMSGSIVEDHPFFTFLPRALRWYAARTLACLLDWKPQVVVSVLEQLNLGDKRAPWLPHPWTLDEEEANIQGSTFRGSARLWNSDEFPLPSSEQVHDALPSSPYLAKVGPGIKFYKSESLHGPNESDEASTNLENQNQDEMLRPQTHLIPTAVTCRNLSLLGAALCQEPHPAPILICGPHGSGKSSLIRELLLLCRPKDSLLEFHIDEETDSKTLIGSYTTTDIPGEFAWRAGALTHASREGRWVLFEDLDSVPVEIQATLVKLLEDRMLPLGNGKYERCHPDFRLFGTCTIMASQHRQQHSLRIGSNRGGGKRILNPPLWRKVHVQPLPYSELKEVAMSLYPDVPDTIFDSALSLLQALDRSGRAETINSNKEIEGSTDAKVDSAIESRVTTLWTGGRNPSVRDFFKLLSRISNAIFFERNVEYATEAQRTLCLAESVDIFVGSCPDQNRKQEFVRLVAAPIWGISRDLASSYVERRRPTTQIGADFIEIGRAKIHIGNHTDFARKPSETFSSTNHALRLMEAAGVCIRENEPVLLVGETGCGKTSLIQQLAANCERELVVQNLSLQTDSTDLLGGYRPLELKHVARRIYQDFVDIFVGTFSRKQNMKFLQYASSMLDKSNWKKLSQCFQRAAGLGLSKMKEQKQISSSKRATATAESWNKFSKAAEKFERQRVSCDAGLAFIFSEGALVDAIQSGKW
jgi:MoxR-like ATPase